MSVARSLDSACDITVQPTVSTLHIPASHAFIPFQQFSISDGSGIRNPADDNNNKTSLPVVSVVTAVSGLCPAIPVVSMQPTAQLAQAVVTPTIIPAVVTPMTVQTANCLPPTTTMTTAMTVANNTLNISSHISMPVQHQTLAGITVNPQATAAVNSLHNSAVVNTSQHSTSATPALNKVSSNVPNTSSLLNSNTTTSAKPNNSSSSGGGNSTKPPPGQNITTEQNEDLVKPVFKDGELVLEVECGQNKAILYLSKLCQGSKGPCISFQSSWLTPNEFQFVSGRETAKDWKRSIRHHGKSLKLLLAKGILNVHPTMCDCDGCRQGATLTRKGEKRRIPNGERKPRKPSGTPSHGGTDGSSTTAFRPMGSSTMAAHLAPPGATHAKPEVKRSGIDKSKMADTIAPSALTETTTKAGNKLGAVQRPNSLHTPKDCTKTTMFSNSLPGASPLRASQSLVATPSTSPTATCKPKPVSGPTTACRVEPFASVASVFPSMATVANAASNSLLVASLSQLGALSTLPPAAPATAAVVEQSGRCPTSDGDDPFNTHSLSPPDSKQPCTQSTTGCHVAESADGSAENSDTDQHMFDVNTDPDVFDNPKTDAGVFHNEDVPVCHELEESQNVDDKSEVLDDDCNDDSSDDSSFKDSENSNCSSSDQINDSGSENDNSLGEMAHTTHPQTEHGLLDDSQRGSQIQEDGACFKDSVEHAATSETAVAEAGVDDEASAGLSVQSVLMATLAVSTVPGAHSQPLSVSVSSNNVKSEHIWVPPKLSPQSQQLQHTPSSSTTTATTPTTPAEAMCSADLGQLPTGDLVAYDHSKNTDRQSTPKKPDAASPAKEFMHSQELQLNQQLKEFQSQQLKEFQSQQLKEFQSQQLKEFQSQQMKEVQKSQQLKEAQQPRQIKELQQSQQIKELEQSQQMKEFQSQRMKEVQHSQQTKELQQEVVKSEFHVAGAALTKEFHSIERHLTLNVEKDRSGVRGSDFSQVKGTQEGHQGGGEKSSRDKEREEKYRQRVKEERSRKEREERNRKDREREERRERERREEKDAERRRQEEKERREMVKGHTESGSNSKETPSSMDISRRAPGGVAEAAAFSDYMRLLAAGHGHPFMSPTLSYMSSLFPVRPPEASVPTHLLHPINAFSSQFAGIPKDPMLYQTAAAGGIVPGYAGHPYGQLHPVLQRHPYSSAQQSLLDYQRSLTAAAASAYSWPTAYPYLMPNVTAASSPAAASTAAATAAAALAAGGKRPTSDIDAAMEMNAKRMRLEGRQAEYTSPWDYFAAASQHQQRAAAMAPSLPCGLESTSMDKTAEYLRKRYMEYGPQAVAYLAATPEYARTLSRCACADHRDDNILMWGVEDVCKFLAALDGCAVYVDHFREQRVTGRILALLTADHFVKTMGMKLGPAVLLSEAVAKKVQDSSKIYNCDACRNMALSQPMHPMALPL